LEDNVDRMSNILGVTWTKPRHFWGKLFTHPLGFPKAKLNTKFKVSTSHISEDVGSLARNFKGHVTYATATPRWGKLFLRPLGFAKTKLYVSNW